MFNELVLFVSTAVLLVLLVPLVSGAPIIPERVRQYVIQNMMLGPAPVANLLVREKMLLENKSPREILADTMCQTCKATCDSKGNCNEKCTDPKRQLQASTTGPGSPLEDSVLEDSTVPGSENGLTTKPGGVLQLPQGNQTFTENTNTTE